MSGVVSPCFRLPRTAIGDHPGRYPEKQGLRTNQKGPCRLIIKAMDGFWPGKPGYINAPKIAPRIMHKYCTFVDLFEIDDKINIHK